MQGSNSRRTFLATVADADRIFNGLADGGQV